MSAPTQPDLSPGTEATFSPESAERLPAFRDSLFRVLSLKAYKFRGTYTQDFDWTMKDLEKKLGRIPTMFETIAVQIVMGAAGGSIKHMHELLDRLEGTVQQNVRVENDNDMKIVVEHRTVALPVIEAEDEPIEAPN